jgi:uncharacterized protein YabE (DUF348 family)
VRRYEVAYVNGVEAGRDLIEERYDPEPVDTVALSGAAGHRSPAGVARVLNVRHMLHAGERRTAADPNYGVTATASS